MQAPIPLGDLHREYGLMCHGTDQAAERVLQRGRFLLGKEGEALESDLSLPLFPQVSLSEVDHVVRMPRSFFAGVDIGAELARAPVPGGGSSPEDGSESRFAPGTSVVAA